MSTISKHTPGTFCWAALGTTDVADARSFYVDLFGWIAFDQEVEATPSTMMILDGRPVCAVFAQSQAHRDDGFPANWLPYVSVENADQTADKVAEAGGQMIEPPFDVVGIGRMAIWQPYMFHGAAVWDEVHALSWMELTTDNVDVAVGFYQKVFGWQPTIDAGYTRLAAGERPVAGAVAGTPQWTVAFQVADCDATVEKARGLGGQVLVPPTDGAVGRTAVLADRQGARFSVVAPRKAG
jgi:predicted enzyme related to lactoylglutathione lyase